MENILNYLSKNKQNHLEELKEVLRIPSISAQTEHSDDVLRTANWLKTHFEKIGLQNAKVMETGGHPVVYADYLNVPNKPTILIYGHYDVQAPDPLNQWITPPFDPTERDGNLYARGTADDKGQFFAHIKAIETILKVNGTLPVNIKVLIEGEEEVGGVNLDKFIEDNKDLLMANVCVISDSHSLSPTQPLIDYGLRGLVYTEIKLTIMPKDVHSGLYGGNIPNAAYELSTLISKLKDETTQTILIPGFYENVRELSESEASELGKSIFNEKAVLEESGVKSLLGVKGKSVAERGGAQPTLEINGMHSGYIAEGAKTIIPASASAKISMRIVPHQTSKEIEEKFKKYLSEITPDYVDLSIEILSTGEPILMNRESEYFRKAELAMEQVFGNKPMYELSGGSIPVTATVKKLLNIDSVLMGFGLPDDGLHSPNEKISIEMFYKGIETSARFLMSF